MHFCRLSNSFDPDQARQDDGPDLGQNCLYFKGYQQATLAGKGFKHVKTDYLAEFAALSINKAFRNSPMLRCTTNAVYDGVF